MDYKTNNHYFHKSYLSLYIGAPLLVISAILVYGNLLPSFILDQIFTVLMVVGGLLTLFSLVSTTKDSEIDESAKKNIAKVLEGAKNKIASLERSPTVVGQYLAESYVFENEKSKEFKKGRDGTFRTDYYSAADITVTSKKLYIYWVEFSLTEESETIETRTMTYDIIQSVRIVEKNIEKQFDKKTYAVKTDFIEIKTDSETLLIPSHNDSLADDLIKLVYIRKEKA